MAHFALLDSNNVVVRVIVVSNDDIREPKEWWDPLRVFTGKESEAVGIAWCQNHWNDPNSRWNQTSYNAGRTGLGHGRGKKGNYAGSGMIYMEGVRTLGVASTDIFISKQPYPSWSIGITTAHWYPPDPPGDRPVASDEQKAKNQYYTWSESRYQSDPSTAWVLTDSKNDGTDPYIRFLSRIHETNDLHVMPPFKKWDKKTKTLIDK